MRFNTIREAAESYVSSFNSIPLSVVEKLQKVSNYTDIYEVTPPSVGDRVYVFNPPEDENYGEIHSIIHLKDCVDYVINLDDGNCTEVTIRDFDVVRETDLPMWGTMWAFGESIDNDWLDPELSYIFGMSGLEAMADCGFRIYESEDYGYIFGIDGAGYDFYESHWIPLYKARGLKWHKEKK